MIEFTYIEGIYMKEISVIEMEQVSGAGLAEMLNGSQGIIPGIADTALGAVYSAVLTASWGSVIGGYYGGSSGGGMFGIGVIGTIVGWGAGVVLGALAGGFYGAYHGVAAGDRVANMILDSFSSGSWVS